MVQNSFNRNNKRKPRHYINKDIYFKEMLVILPNGEKVGPLSKEEALLQAQKHHLDLVLVSSDSKNPVAKLIDYGKYCYDLIKKQKILKKKQQTNPNKEIRVKLNTDQHDLEYKAKKIINFLKNGSKVKISLRLRGRENIYPDLGRDKLELFYQYFNNYAQIEVPIKKTGLLLEMHVIPAGKNKKNYEK